MRSSAMADPDASSTTFKRRRFIVANDMTAEQRSELKRLCDQADVPDKSGELLSQAEAQQFIDDLKKQISERKAGG